MELFLWTNISVAAQFVQHKQAHLDIAGWNANFSQVQFSDLLYPVFLCARIHILISCASTAFWSWQLAEKDARECEEQFVFVTSWVFIMQAL